MNAQATIRDYMNGQSVASLSVFTMTCFVGMLESGEATVTDFDECGVDLMQLANRYGSCNCWAGTSGSVAARLHAIIKEQRI